MGDYKFVEGETMELIQAALALKIRALRAEKGMSQKSLSMHTNVNKSYIYLLERGAANPTLQMLTKVAYALGVDIVGLLADLD